MSDKPNSLLRQRMIDDMTARRFSEKVQKAYVPHVRTFTAFLGRSPDTATSEDLRRYQIAFGQAADQPRSINAAGAPVHRPVNNRRAAGDRSADFDPRGS